eukprot:14615646-Alexandrium_andersonii.AAC.1
MEKSGKYARTEPLLRSGCALRGILGARVLEGLRAHLQTWRMKRRENRPKLVQYQSVTRYRSHGGYRAPLP